ncbi:ribosome maturation factor RimP [Clostridium bornimense]|uniref:ribosome maturation factor RimP n=1 Tax=Clostridium bornimense TaxID=1216932 RepID=UPI001C10F235|nr:ribosome maturation factor RimP [Clostridium bornimense]MBU5314834.1 ribosome maturation factor RimP [Clostridium bornimense]
MNGDVLVQKITDLVRPIVEGKGYILYHVEYVKEAGDNYLRIYIDKEDGGVGLSDCEMVSRRISELVDENDPIEDKYFLEVSSPGIFRTLFTDEHLEKYTGEQVDIKTKSVFKGKKKLTGILKSFDINNIILNLDGEDLEIPREKIKIVNLNNFSF